ncbi:hypothetical protein C0991_005144, partial [Blastosporella zonata]
VHSNITISLGLASQLPPIFSGEVRSAILDAIPILLKLGAELSLKDIFTYAVSSRKRESLSTKCVNA